ncbi:hypothetical protein L218DRAFT_240355 [Marasmius fiardii PR-910]|nr:hypothetical protein L218DRAFT_240355 [Marasmius fiardii PR-910]
MLTVSPAFPSGRGYRPAGQSGSNTRTLTHRPSDPAVLMPPATPLPSPIRSGGYSNLSTQGSAQFPVGQYTRYGGNVPRQPGGPYYPTAMQPPPSAALIPAPASAGAAHVRSGSISSVASGYVPGLGSGGSDSGNSSGRSSRSSEHSAEESSNKVDRNAPQGAWRPTHRQLGSVFGGDFQQHPGSASTSNNTNPVVEVAEDISVWECEYCGQEIVGTANDEHYRVCKGLKRSE